MIKKVSKILIIIFTVLMFAPNIIKADDDNVKEINLSSVENADGTYSFKADLNGESINEYDYCWHIDPNGDYSEVKNSPAEYYTGTKPNGEAIYIAHDIYYYPELDSSLYKQAKYGDDNEWVFYYQNEKYNKYVLATLPIENNAVPTRMMHSQQEAYNNAVLHINEAGTYRLTGNWHGQIYVDLGEDSFDDESAVVTLILDNVDINCTVASGICFYQVYECDNQWEDRQEAITTVDTSAAGANIIIADDSVNNVSGANIYRILKTKYKDEDSTDAVPEQKKRLKVDGALYSYMSLNVSGQDKGNGILNIDSEFEGLDSELHLTINSGHININADNDGINVNEDNVSIFTINGGTLQILAGTGCEGDGIDSNGYLIINGGTVISSAKEQADSGLDSDKGTFINGGTVIAFGSSMDTVDEYSEDAKVVTMNLIFSQRQNLTDGVVFAKTSGKAIFGFDLSANEFFNQANRQYQCLVVASEKFNVSDKYYIYQSNSIKGNQENGIYAKVNSFSKDGQFTYGSTGSKGNFPGGKSDFDPSQQGGNNQPGSFDPSQQGGNQKGDFDPSQQQGGNNQPGNFNQNEGMPTDFNQGQFNNNGQAYDTFEVEDMVNTFSSVSTTAATSTNQIVTNIWTMIAIGFIGLACGVVTTILAFKFIPKMKLQKKNED